MTDFTQFLDFVNGQTAFHDAKAAFWEKKHEGSRGSKHREFGDKFRALAAELNRLYEIERGRPRVAPKQLTLALSPEDVAGLPAELLEELSLSEGDKLDFAIQSAIANAGGALSIDKLLIILWRETGEVHKRVAINSRLYRLVQKDILYTVPGRKGVYSNREMTEEEAATLA